VSRDPRGRFKPGGPPGPGRPPGRAGMSRQILGATRDGAEMVEFALDVMRDEARPHRDRWAALEWLADRGAGKSTQALEVDVEVGGDLGPLQTLDLREMTDDALQALIAGLSTALAVPVDGPPRLPLPRRLPAEHEVPSSPPSPPAPTDAPHTPEEWRAHAARLAERDRKP
jgi:hypothetical protein